MLLLLLLLTAVLLQLWGKASYHARLAPASAKALLAAKLPCTIVRYSEVRDFVDLLLRRMRLMRLNQSRDDAYSSALLPLLL